MLLTFGVIALGGLLAYSNTLRVPFLFDDLSSILRNSTIRDLGSLNALSAPLDATGATGRPLVNLSLAFNYAIGRTDVRGYHLFNLSVHVACAFLLFGIMRRTLSRESVFLAGAVALLWIVHPLQTESVTCIIQRTELLGGFFLLLTLYGFIRSTSSAHARFWAIFSILACAFGMAAKEFMVTAPLLVLLYDRSFVSGTFRNAWRARHGYYLGLAATWIVLAGLLVQFPQRNHNVGFGLGVSSWDYLLTQCRALTLYLKLSLWPHPLVLDYGMPVDPSLTAVWWRAVIVVGLLSATVWALWRRPMLGFVGAWFFVILSPSSSFVPLTTQTIAEHRMYLPLASVVVLVVLLLWRYTGRYALPVSLGLGVALVAWTWQRNEIYASGLSIWADTVAKAPGNFRAHYNFGNALAAAIRSADALAQYEAALRLKPNEPTILYNYASTLVQSGRVPEGIVCFQEALKYGPAKADVLVNLGAALASAERFPEAIEAYRRAASLEPKASDIRASLGSALIAAGHLDEGIRELEAAVATDPSNLDARVELADILAEIGRIDEATAHYNKALGLQPGSAALRQRLEQARDPRH